MRLPDHANKRWIAQPQFRLQMFLEFECPFRSDLQ